MQCQLVGNQYCCISVNNPLNNQTECQLRLICNQPWGSNTLVKTINANPTVSRLTERQTNRWQTVTNRCPALYHNMPYQIAEIDWKQKSAYLQHFIGTGFNTWDHVCWGESDLLHISKVVLGVLVQHHTTNGNQRELSLWPNLKQQN